MTERTAKVTAAQKNSRRDMPRKIFRGELL